MLKDIYNSLVVTNKKIDWSEGILDNPSQLFFSLKSLSGLKIEPKQEPFKIYCLASLEKQTIQTSSVTVIDNTTPLEWNEGYTFDVMSSNAVLSISIWQSNKSSSLSPDIEQQQQQQHNHNNNTTNSITTSLNTEESETSSSLMKSIQNQSGKLIGKLVLPYSNFQKQQFLDQWIPLVGNPSVSVHIKLSYTNSTKKVYVNDFVFLRMIGKGAFGQVNLVKKVDTGRLYAMKIIKKDRCLDMNAVGHTFTERKLLKKYYHPFIVGLKYSFQTQDSLCMVLDYIGGGELFYHISEQETFSEETARFYISQIMMAIGFLHEHGVIYRDLKLENLLMDLDGNICLVDLGLCKEGIRDGIPTYTMCGSPEYIAPEIINGSGYGKSVDWWALGTLFYEMIAGLPPFYSEDPQEMTRLILSAPIKFPPGISKNAASLITLLLNRDPSKRLGSGESDVEEIKSHPFFKSVNTNWSKVLNKEIDPPFKPHLNGPLDLSYFDPVCTIHSLPINPNTINTNLSESDQMAFQGFSYSAPEFFNLTNGHVNTNNNSNPSSGNNSPMPQQRKLSTPPPQNLIGSLKISNSNDDLERMSPMNSSPIIQHHHHLHHQSNNSNNSSPVNSLKNSINLNNSNNRTSWVHSQYPNLQHPLPQKPILSKFQETTFERRRSQSINAQTQFTLVLGEEED
eukprot:gene692-853_t